MPGGELATLAVGLLLAACALRDGLSLLRTSCDCDDSVSLRKILSHGSSQLGRRVVTRTTGHDSDDGSRLGRQVVTRYGTRRVVTRIMARACHARLATRTTKEASRARFRNNAARWSQRASAVTRPAAYWWRGGGAFRRGARTVLGPRLGPLGHQGGVLLFRRRCIGRIRCGLRVLAAPAYILSRPHLACGLRTFRLRVRGSESVSPKSGRVAPARSGRAPSETRARPRRSGAAAHPRTNQADPRVASKCFLSIPGNARQEPRDGRPANQKFTDQPKFLRTCKNCIRCKNRVMDDRLKGGPLGPGLRAHGCTADAVPRCPQGGGANGESGRIGGAADGPRRPPAASGPGRSPAGSTG